MAVSADSQAFEAALALIAELKRQGVVFIAFKPPFTVTFEVNKDVLSKALSSAGLDQATFERESSAIGEMLLAVLEERKDAYITRETADITGEDEQERRVAQLHRQVDAVAELADDRLRSRYQLKATSKAPAFASVDWDTKLKTYDAKVGEIRYPYATVKITFQRDFRFEPETFFGRNLFDSIQINLTKDEVDYLVGELGAIRDKLTELEENR